VASEPFGRAQSQVVGDRGDVNAVLHRLMHSIQRLPMSWATLSFGLGDHALIVAAARDDINPQAGSSQCGSSDSSGFFFGFWSHFLDGDVYTIEALLLFGSFVSSGCVLNKGAKMQVLSLETCSFRDISVLQSDGEVIEAVLGGDRKAFAILVRRYERSVRAVAMSVLRDRHLAQDAGQEAFVKAFEKLGSLRRAEAFGPWLLKISRRCALDLVHKQRAQSLPEEDILEAKPAGLLSEEKEHLLAAVVRLRESERQVVMLRHFGGYSVQEVADIAGRSVGTVTKQLSRAHRQLRVLLGEA